jgi:hypothetical protein
MGEEIRGGEEPSQEKLEEVKPELKKATMRIICAWCQKEMGTKEDPTGDGSRITHSICDECTRKAMEDNG